MAKFDHENQMIKTKLCDLIKLWGTLSIYTNQNIGK